MQVIPESYVAASLNPIGSYRYQWWAMNDAYFNRAVSRDIKSAIGLHGQRIPISPKLETAVAVLTKYQHSANQGYALNKRLNFPGTCTARNSCSADNGSGSRVPSYDLHTLVELIAALGE